MLEFLIVIIVLVLPIIILTVRKKKVDKTSESDGGTQTAGNSIHKIKIGNSGASIKKSTWFAGIAAAITLVVTFIYWGSFTAWVSSWFSPQTVNQATGEFVENDSKGFSLQTVEEAPEVVWEWITTYTNTFIIIVVVSILVLFIVSRFRNKKDKEAGGSSDWFGNILAFVLLSTGSIIAAILAVIALIVVTSIFLVFIMIFTDLEVEDLKIWEGSKTKVVQPFTCTTQNEIYKMGKAGKITAPTPITICVDSGQLFAFAQRGKRLTIALNPEFKTYLFQHPRRDMQRLVHFANIWQESPGAFRMTPIKASFKEQGLQYIEVIVAPAL